MLLRNIRAFGNFTPGDEIEVPDGAGFDRAHFERADEEPTPVKDEAPEKAPRK